MIEQQRKKQREDVSRLATVVDTIALKYSGDRYSNISTIITNSSAEPDTETYGDVPEEFLGLWLFTVEPTQKELDIYEEVLVELS